MARLAQPAEAPDAAGSARWALLAAIPATALVVAPSLVDGWVLPKLFVLRTLLAGAAVCCWACAPSLPQVRGPVVGAALVLLGVHAAATAVSVAPVVSLRGAYQSCGGLLTLVDGVLVLLLAATLVRTQAERARLAALVALTAAVSALLGVAQHLGLVGLLWDVGHGSGSTALRHRAFGLMGSPSFLGLYLAMALPLTLAAATASKERRLQHIGWLALPPLVIGLVLTYGRAAWLAAAVVAGPVLLAVVPKPARRRAVLMLTASLLVGIGLAPAGGGPSAVARAGTFASPRGGSVEVRRDLWAGAWEMAQSRPWLGFGPDTFRFVYPRFAPAGTTEEQRRNPSSHNIVLDTLVQSGWVGLLASLALWTTVALAGAWAARAWIDTDEASAMVWGCVLVAYLIGLQFGFASTPINLLAWIAAGVLAAARPDGPLRCCRRGEWLLLSLVAMALLAHTGRRLLGEAAFSRSQTQFATGAVDEGLASLQRAVRLDPACDLYQASAGQLLATLGGDMLPYCTAAVAANPVQAGNAALLAEALEAREQWSAAEVAWRRTVALDPWWVEAHVALGAACQKLGRPSQAIAAYRCAIRLDPKSAAAFNNLGNAYLSMGRQRDAIAAYRTALALQPGWSVAQRNLAAAVEARPPRTPGSDRDDESG